jgi:DNA/RNA-binding domain of Phe-tRNA-synthetase-like protein
MIAPVSLDISEVAGNFPAFRVALVVADALVIPAARPPMLEAFVEETAARVARDLAGVELADVAELKAWRQAYRTFGVKKTNYRSSVERLLKNIQRGAGLPRVNVLVDAYNAISAFYRMPVGADDLDRVTPPVSFRYALPGDTFVGLGDPAATPDPPQVGEVVYADAEKCLCRRWNWYQDGRSAIAPHTTCAVLTVQTLADDDGELQQAASHLADLIAGCSGGRAHWAIASASAPLVAVSRPSGI